MNSKDLKDLIKKVVEVLRPELDHYRKPLRKARVIETYASDGRYVCDIEILLNNNQPDESAPIVKGVEIPVIWGGKKRGIVCPPSPGTYCDVEYYHGDPNYPRISNFRWLDNAAPDAEVDELIIQQEPGVHIHIKSNNDIEIKSPANLSIIFDGDVTAQIGGDMIADVQGGTTVKAMGGVCIDGGSSDLSGVVTHNCICPVTLAPHLEFSKNVKASKGG